MITLHEGQVVKTIGDEVTATFPGADLAINAAIGMQLWAHDAREMCGQALGLRVGPASAGSGQIVTSRSTRDAMGMSLQKRCRDLGATSIPGREEPLDIVSVTWGQDTSNVTASTYGSSHSGLRVPRQLVLAHAAMHMTVSDHSSPATPGRDADSSVVVDGECVSRHHARIEFCHGFYVLFDQSTNGTWLALEGQSQVLVHRGELPLRCNGYITLGKREAPGGLSTLSFQLEDV